MAANEETRVVENNAAKESDIKIGLSFQQSFVLVKSNLIQRAVIFGLTIFLIYKYMQNQDPHDVINNFLVKNIWAPLFLVNLVLTLCLLYYVFALTQTSLRFLYIDVFYVNVFAQLVRIFFSVYMLVIIFVPHTYYISDTKRLVSFDRSYIIIAALIFSYVLIDSLLIITYVASIYFRMEKVKKQISKYWFVRLFIYFFIDIFLVGYYLFLLITTQFDVIYAVLFGLCLLGALSLAYCLKVEMCQPSMWKLKELDENRIPTSEKIKLAVKIMEMKREVKEVAETA